MAAFALLIALYAPEGVFGLVLIAWSALGAALGPVLVIRLFRLPITAATGLAMMLTAVTVVSLWHVSPYDDAVFKALPGFLSAALVYAAARGAGRVRRLWRARRSG